MQELRTELDEALRAKDQLERVTFQLVDEVRQLKGKVDGQGVDVNSLVNDLKNRSKKLEEENRHAVSATRFLLVFHCIRRRLDARKTSI
jgi:beta-lactamase class A